MVGLFQQGKVYYWNTGTNKVRLQIAFDFVDAQFLFVTLMILMISYIVCISQPNDEQTQWDKPAIRIV